MDKQLKKKWVDALRSGEYEQGRNRLRSQLPSSSGKYLYCCLGVLCEVAQLKEWDGEAFISTYPGDDGYEYTSIIPDNIRDRIGITATQAGILMVMNDGTSDTDRRSFDEIATYIEENL